MTSYPLGGLFTIGGRSRHSRFQPAHHNQYHQRYQPQYHQRDQLIDAIRNRQRQRPKEDAEEVVQQHDLPRRQAEIEQPVVQMPAVTGANGLAGAPAAEYQPRHVDDGNAHYE